MQNKIGKWNITSRLELLLAKIAGHDVDLSIMTPPVASNLIEELLLEIADKSGGGQLPVPTADDVDGVVKVRCVKFPADIIVPEQSVTVDDHGVSLLSGTDLSSTLKFLALLEKAQHEDVPMFALIDGKIIEGKIEKSSDYALFEKGVIHGGLTQFYFDYDLDAKLFALRVDGYEADHVHDVALYNADCRYEYYIDNQAEHETK